MTLGGRHFEYDRLDTAIFNPVLLLSDPDVKEDVGQNGQTYKANLAFTPNEDVLIYALWSEGFRLGKGQSVPSSDFCDFPDGTKLTSRVEPDTTSNVELGAKLSALDNRLTINTAIFHTVWDNLPTSISPTNNPPCFNRIINNIGSAESQGIEMDINYYLSDDWQLSLGASYIDTKRVEVRVPFEEGERLPYAPRTNAILGLQYNFTANGFNSYVRTDIAYVGEYESAPAYLDEDFRPGGDYTNVNLRFGMTIEQWDLAIYAINLSNNDELLVQANGNGSDEGRLGVRSRPRQMGLAFNYSF